MQRKLLKSVSVLICTSLLASCGFFDKDNVPSPAPLVVFKPEATPHYLWSVGTGDGTGGEFLKMTPAMGPNSIFTTSNYGTVTSINQTTGRVNWQLRTRILTAAGPGVGDGIVAIAARKGGIVALHALDGSLAWKAHAQGEILSAPTIQNGVLIVKTTDGSVYAFSSQTGRHLWQYNQTEPNLVLHGSSQPIISDHSVFVGFANGNLAKLNLTTGDEAWQQPVATAEGAFAIQRMIDIDANPLVYGHRIFAATYQGNISAMRWDDGSTIWSQHLSSFTGMTTDGSNVYITDARSHLWSINVTTGKVNWRQTQLDARVITAPALTGRYLVVGDAEGYVHWMDKLDGHFVARIKAGAPIYATPLVVNNVTYIFTNKGYLQSYLLG